MSYTKNKTNIYAVRTIIGQEASVAELINAKAKKKGLKIISIMVSESLRGYVFIEA
ncbi:MAG: hypothetical protein ACTSYR_04310 [Candidatus Odinarchaeia archaeon]